MAVGNLVDETSAFRRPTVEAGHVRLGPSLVDEDQARGVDLPLRRDRAVAGSCASSHGVLEFRGLLRSAGRIPSAVGMRARSGELAAVHDKIFIPDRALFEPAFENLPCARRVARLGRKGCPGNVRRHAVVRHRAPRVVSRRRLREPDVAGIAGELPAFERADDGVTVADFAPRCVHEIRATLHSGNKLVIEETLRFRMKRRVDRDDVADFDHVLEIGMPCEIQFLLDRL